MIDCFDVGTSSILGSAVFQQSRNGVQAATFGSGLGNDALIDLQILFNGWPK